MNLGGEYFYITGGPTISTGKDPPGPSKGNQSYAPVASEGFSEAAQSTRDCLCGLWAKPHNFQFLFL